ncbi:MAG: glycosyltransferase family 2 protein [Alphaproteobacteria bacterium]|nr:MAG: glycosyltransferase family 2 protein [Alphaproteobacteria bacterium]
MPLISILTPAWNAARTLPMAKAGIDAQSLTDWEWLVADDGSDDGSQEMLAAWSRKDPRIRLLSGKGRAGPALARARALAEAKGRFLAFLDADDSWHSDKLAAQTAAHRATPTPLTYTGWQAIDAQGAPLGRGHAVPERLTYRALLCNTAIVCSSAMIDREQSGPVTIRNEPVDDYVLWLSLLSPRIHPPGRTAIGLPAPLTLYRRAPGSLSSRPCRAASWAWHTYRHVECLSLPYSLWCFAHYAARAVVKRMG